MDRQSQAVGKGIELGDGVEVKAGEYDGKRYDGKRYGDQPDVDLVRSRQLAHEAFDRDHFRRRRRMFDQLQVACMVVMWVSLVLVTILSFVMGLTMYKAGIYDVAALTAMVGCGAGSIAILLVTFVEGFRKLLLRM